MKYYIILVLLFSCVGKNSHAQTPAEDLANKIAGKMQDSLSLTPLQKSQIYSTNMQLHSRKMDVRQQYSDSDLVRSKIQQIENTRDSLYHIILTNDQYILYH